MLEFSYFIFYPGLMDPSFVGGTFTWLNNRESPSWSRIDRFLVFLALEAQFMGLSQRRLCRLRSDHFPILLDCDDFHRGSRCFKFENMWLKSEGFVDMVKQ
jgi:hypothetical protein